MSARAHCPKMNKKSMWEKKFKISVHGTSNSAILRLHLVGLLEQYLAENISLERSNCIIFGLSDIVALFANEARFFRFRVILQACSLLNEVGDPLFYYISEIINSSTLSGKSLRKKSMLKNFRANVLKWETLVIWIIYIPTRSEEWSMIQISLRIQDPNSKTGTIRNPRLSCYWSWISS